MIHRPVSANCRPFCNGEFRISYFISVWNYFCNPKKSTLLHYDTRHVFFVLSAKSWIISAFIIFPPKKRHSFSLMLYVIKHRSKRSMHKCDIVRCWLMSSKTYCDRADSLYLLYRMTLTVMKIGGGFMRHFSCFFKRSWFP